MKFLLDEHAEGFDKKLIHLGYQVEYVKKLREKDEKFRNDHNVIEYAKNNQMILITKDHEPGQACEDNGYPCIWINDEKIFEKIIRPQINELPLEKRWNDILAEIPEAYRHMEECTCQDCFDRLSDEILNSGSHEIYNLLKPKYGHYNAEIMNELKLEEIFKIIKSIRLKKNLEDFNIDSFIFDKHWVEEKAGSKYEKDIERK